MPTVCKHSSGRVINVDFLLTDNCFHIDTKQCYHILLIDNGLLSIEIDGETVGCPSPCLLVLKEDSEVKFVASHMLSAVGIRFGVDFLNPNVTFDLINSGKYESGEGKWGFFPLEPFYRPRKAYQRCLPLTVLESLSIKESFYSFRDAIEEQIDFRWSCRARQHLEIILELAFRIYRDVFKKTVPILNLKDKNVWVSMILREIHARYSSPLTVIALAKQININKTTIEIGFREVMGTSINNYLINYRLLCASKLLATTDLSATEIGKQCGYQNPTFFSRQFKARIGTTPLEYRKRIVRERKSEFAEKIDVTE